MADHQFEDAELAALYDRFCAWDSRDDLAFYLPIVMASPAVLDVGCGTGMLLKRARDAGHTGRLCGLDPAAGMLTQARTRTDVEWVHGDLTETRFAHDFDLVVMTGHAFQVFVTDTDLQHALAAIAAALRPGGHFAFETRNPSVYAWKQWTPAHAQTVDGIRMEHVVDEVNEQLVRFTTTYTSDEWTAPQYSHSTLRFLDAATLSELLAEAGLVVVEQYGDWDRSASTAESPEIITIARSDS